MQDQDRLPTGLPKIAFAGGFVERQLPDQNGAATDQGLPWLTGVAFIVCTSIAAWCALAMMLTGLYR